MTTQLTSPIRRLGGGSGRWIRLRDILGWLLECRDQARQRGVAGDLTEAFLRLQQRVRKPATCLIGLGSKTCHPTDLATCIQKRIFYRIGAQQGTMKSAGDFQAMKSEQVFASLVYLKKYRANMDFAERKQRGDPIGSGITEAGCKVIFNQRLKQSGMRWNGKTGQYIVDLRTANRSGIWRRIWSQLISSKTDLPPITHVLAY